MRIGNKLFPYPTLNASQNMNTFKESSFYLEYEEFCEGNELVLKNARIVTDNIKIIQLLKDGTIEAKIIIECSATVYRVNKKIDLEYQDIIIPLHNLRDKVVISSFIHAKKEFTYVNDDFLDDYAGYSFRIEKNNILAIDDGFTMKIEYDESKDNKIASIFSIIKSSDEKLHSMKVEFTTRKINIFLPESQFGFYDNLKGNDNFQNIFFSILAVPALSHCLQKLQKEDSDIELIRMEYSWFESILKGYLKLYDKELNSKIFSEMDILRFSQEVLNNATVNSIENFFSIVTNSSLGGGFDDE